jgi:DNA repair exonuclease SbcCD ATPase subunit
MKLIREIETKHILNIYNSMSAQQLLDYILSYHNDSDCKYIFDNLPQKLQDRIDELAGEQIAEVRKQIVERDQQIAEVRKQIVERDQQIADVIKKREEIDRNIEKIQKERIEVQKQSAIIKQFNIDMDNKNYILERQIEDMKELNRQF